MRPTQTAPSPLQPRSPSLQNVPSAKSPFGKALPLRKPSLRDAIPSPKRPRDEEAQPVDSPQPKRSKVAPVQPKAASKPAPDYDMADLINREVQQKYVKDKFLGSGTYANVYKAYLKSDPTQIFAIKKFKTPDPYIKQQFGIAVDTIREIKYLQELRHMNVVRLYDVYLTKAENINMVIEFFSGGDLEQVIRDGSFSYGLADVKAWMGMILRGMYFCHANFVLHRDLKPSNLLIAADGEVKIADFGLARSIPGPELRMTTNVITMWYRPPELLFGARHYGGAVDMWSIGLIMAELLTRKPFAAFFDPDDPGALERADRQTELGQLDVINQRFGTPREDNWPGVSQLPLFVELEPYIPPRTKTQMRSYISTIDDAGLELLMATLTFDPRRRFSAKRCLEHEWWSIDPRPTDKDKLPRKMNVDEQQVAKDIAQKPGVIEEKFKGVARKLDFSGKK